MFKNIKYFMYKLFFPTHFVLFLFIAINNTLYANDFFTVDNINIDIIAEDINLAREDATKKAILLGLERLLSWKLNNEDFIFIESLFKNNNDSSDIKNFVTGYKIHYESLSNINYKAEFSVFYDLTKISNWLYNYNKYFFEKRVFNVLNIPIITINENTILWDAPNPWSLIWQSNFKKKDMVNFLYANGDIEDVINLTPDDLHALNIEKILNFSSRYSVNNILIPSIVVNKYSNNYDAVINVDLIMEKNVISIIKDIKIQPDENELLNNFLIRVSSLISMKLKNYWNKNQIDYSKTVYLNASFNNYQNWRLLTSSLKNIVQVKEYQILSLSYKKAFIKIKIDIINEAALFNIFNKSRIDIQKSINRNKEYNVSLINYHKDNLNLLDSNNQTQKKESSILLTE